MDYTNVKSLDQIIVEVSAVNQTRLREKIAHLLLKVLPDELKLPDIKFSIHGVEIGASLSKKLSDSLDAMRKSMEAKDLTRGVLEQVSQYREHLSKGHRYSFGNDPEVKRHAAAEFASAEEIATEIIKTKGLPAKWPFIPLVLEARSCLATTHFWAEDYNRADELFALAESELLQARRSGEYSVEGTCDREIALKAFHLSTFAAKAAHDGLDEAQISDDVYRYFDSDLTPLIREELTEGGERIDCYTSPLLQWMRDCFQSGQLICPGESEREFALMLRRAARRERMSMSGKYMANRGWLEILLFSRSSDTDHLIRTLNYYCLAMDTLVDAYCNAHAGWYKVEKGGAREYCKHDDFYEAQAQNSLARNLTYCIAALGLAGERADDERSMLISVWQKDVRRGSDSRVAINSIRSAVWNLEKLGLGTAWAIAVSDLPNDLIESIGPLLSR